MIAKHELGQIAGASVASLRSHADALALSLELTVRGSAGEVLNDEEHALLTQWVKQQLQAFGWGTEPEVSFNIYGDRGRIDLLGWPPGRRVVLIDEQKTDVSDVQDVLGTIDRFAGLFDRFSVRGTDAARWLRDPAGPAHVLIFVPPSAVGRAAWRNGRRRVRKPAAAA